MLPITYKSSNKKVATVDEAGMITGVAKGAATVSVTYEKQTLKVQVYVCESFKPYTCPAIFSVDYPATWEVKENFMQYGSTTCKAAFFTPRQSAQDFYRENVQITMEVLPESFQLTPDDYLSALIAASKLLNSNFKFPFQQKNHICRNAGQNSSIHVYIGAIQNKSTESVLYLQIILPTLFPISENKRVLTNLPSKYSE